MSETDATPAGGPGSDPGTTPAGEAESAPAGRTADAATSLWRNRDFRRFLAGQFVTNAGDSLYGVAILWLVFRLSGSTVLTGVASSLLLLPYLLQVVAGPLVDRFHLKRLLVGAQLAQGVVVLVVPLAAATGHLSVALLLAIVPVLALLTVLVAPVPTALLPRIVADDRLSRGNSALATVTLGLDMVFDALGGAFIAVFGATSLFLLDSATFAVAAVLFAGMAVPAVESGATGDGPGADADDEPTVRAAVRAYRDDLRAGVDLLRGSVFVEMLLAAAVSNFAVGVALAVLPAFGDALGGPAVYGLLLGALGVGRLVGSWVAPSLEGIPYGRLTAASFLLAAGLWFGAAYAPGVASTVALFGLAWVGAGANGVLTSTLNQQVFPAESLGRVSAIKGTASTATLPLGSLFGGVVAAVLGPTTTMALSAGGFGFVGAFYALRPSLRGLPAVADADPAAFGVEVDRPAAGEE